MRIKYSPQRSDVPLSYQISAEAIAATLAGQVDTFDFSGLPTGRSAIIESVLTPCPVLAAERTDVGELIVTLLHHHGPDAPDSERFPAEEAI